MSEIKEIKVPDIGNYSNVEIIEVPVSAGDTVAPEDTIITLETEKASMDVPCPFAGKIKEMKVKLGDKVSQGDVVALVEIQGDANGKKAEEKEQPESPKKEEKEEKSEEKSAKSSTLEIKIPDIGNYSNVEI